MADADASIVAFDQSLGFTVNAIDRIEARRNEPAFIEALRERADSDTLVFVGEDVVLQASGRPWFGVGEAQQLGAAEFEVLLGLREGRGCFALALSEEQAEPLKARPEVTVTDLRSIATGGAVPIGDVGPLAQAKAVLSWHRRHRFCPSCGAGTVMAAAGWRRECNACGLHHFPRTDPVVIMMAVDGDRCLLGRQPRFPPGMYSCLAGFLEPGETIEDAVRRELNEEAGIATGAVAYLGSQPWPFPTSIMIGCLAQATSTALTIDHAELEDARWFTREETRAIMEGRHPEGFRCPPVMAIAHHLMRSWVDSVR